MKISTFPLSTIMMLAASTGIAVADKLIAQPLSMELLLPDDSVGDMSHHEQLFVESCAKEAHNKYFGNDAGGKQSYDIDVMEVVETESLVSEDIDGDDEDINENGDHDDEDIDIDMNEDVDENEYLENLFGDDEDVGDYDDNEDFDYDYDYDYDEDEDEDEENNENRNLRLKFKRRFRGRVARKPAPRPTPRPTPSPTYRPAPKNTPQDPLAAYKYNPWEKMEGPITWVKRYPRNENERMNIWSIIEDPKFKYKEWYTKYFRHTSIRLKAIAEGKCEEPCYDWGGPRDPFAIAPIDLRSPNDRKLKKMKKSKMSTKKLVKANKMFCKCVESSPFPALNEVMACKLDFGDGMILGEMKTNNDNE